MTEPTHCGICSTVCFYLVESEIESFVMFMLGEKVFVKSCARSQLHLCRKKSLRQTEHAHFLCQVVCVWTLALELLYCCSFRHVCTLLTSPACISFVNWQATALQTEPSAEPLVSEVWLCPTLSRKPGLRNRTSQLLSPERCCPMDYFFCVWHRLWLSKLVLQLKEPSQEWSILCLPDWWMWIVIGWLLSCNGALPPLHIWAQRACTELKHWQESATRQIQRTTWISWSRVVLEGVLPAVPPLPKTEGFQALGLLEWNLWRSPNLLKSSWCQAPVMWPARGWSQRPSVWNQWRQSGSRQSNKNLE